MKLFRKRYIPDELIELNNDEIVTLNDEMIITRWQALTPRHSFTHGVSCHYLKKNFKVSKFLDENNNIVYWYCDIMDFEYISEKDCYIFKDLLVDVIVYPDGRVEVLDIGEVAEALESGIIDLSMAALALRKIQELIDIIYAGEFDKLTVPIEML